MFFQPADGVNVSLHIEVINSTVVFPLAPVSIALDGYPGKGVEGVIKLGTAATLPLSILGSIRAIRDCTEGPSLLHPKLQEGIKTAKYGRSGIAITRVRLDNVKTTTLTLTPRASQSVAIDDCKATFDAGEYLFTTHINYPQLEQFSLHSVLKDPSLIDEHQHETKVLSFLSYSDKLLAGS